MTISLDQLVEIASRSLADPDDWYSRESIMRGGVVSEHDAVFIETFTPAVVLGLLSAIDRLDGA